MRPLSLLMLLILSAVALTLSGCEEPESVPTEPKRVDDRVTRSELRAFLTIVEDLPGKQLPELPPVLAASPDWTTHRTLPVSDLVREETTSSEQRAALSRLAERCPRTRAFRSALRRQQMTVEQFLGLYLALGFALSRDALPDERNLDLALDWGRRAIEELKRDRRVFSSLSEEEAFLVREKANWLAVVIRIRELQRVPPENVTLVRKNHAALRKLFPVEFTHDPLAEFARIVDDYGVPFHEGREGSDDRLPWPTMRAASEPIRSPGLSRTPTEESQSGDD